MAFFFGSQGGRGALGGCVAHIGVVAVAHVYVCGGVGSSGLCRDAGVLLRLGEDISKRGEGIEWGRMV